MTWHDPNHTGSSIFVNKENFVFALPLLSLCSLYAYFKLVPLNIALSLIGAGIVLYKATTGIKKHAIEKKEQKIANLDESLLKELAADELLREEKESKAAAKKKTKADQKAKQRLAAQKKKENQRYASKVVEEEDDADMSTFVKGKKKR